MQDDQNQTYEDYGNEDVYEEYVEVKHTTSNFGNEKRQQEDRNISNEKFHEGSAGNYETYVPRYATYSKDGDGRDWPSKLKPDVADINSTS